MTSPGACLNPALLNHSGLLGSHPAASLTTLAVKKKKKEVGRMPSDANELWVLHLVLLILTLSLVYFTEGSDAAAQSLCPGLPPL